MPVDPESQQEEGETSAADEWRSLAETVAYVSSGGIQIVVASVLGFFAGRWIDGKIGSQLVFTALLAVVGLAAGVFQMMRAIQALQKRQAGRK